MFFSKKLEFFLKSAKVKFAVECVSNDNIFLKYLFQFICDFFWLKIRKFPKLEQLNNMMKKQSILKKELSSFKRHLYQSGKAENMLVVAGRLVFIHF